jgi:hypothetical protein
MTQLETSGSLAATWLPFDDPEPIDSSRAAPAQEAAAQGRTGDASADESFLYVSPPPMPWPRVFPSL